MNGYKILKCFNKEKRVLGELPCPASYLIGNEELHMPLSRNAKADFDFHSNNSYWFKAKIDERKWLLTTGCQ